MVPSVVFRRLSDSLREKKHKAVIRCGATDKNDDENTKDGHGLPFQ